MYSNPMKVSIALASVLITVTSTAAQSSKLYHRVFHPSFAQLPYVERGTLVLSPDTNQISLESSPSLAQDLAGFADVLQSIERNASSPLYQIALQHKGDASEAQWDISSVKVCHLSQATSETLILHLADAKDATPFALEYFVEPIPHDGSCQSSSSTSKKSKITPATSHMQTFADQQINTKVLFRIPASPPLPELRTPPPLTPEGEVVKPVPEQGFLQKYWMYMVAVFIALAFAGGSDEERPARQ
ncbi:hypothetical protein BDQ12DRAFT_731439 [Crucibulum laeve]|uniref:Uncharacterized protein n=1 Tax=Crucibulum laeve TaxID=68775 RepID=A0A5C3MDM3_9AGAR|nr:hypothetical protein BDQ12DRAFT_731439 [Crucibulum laeve]